MIKRIAKRGVGLILAGIMTAGIVLPSCNKKKSTNTIPLPGAPVLYSPPNRAIKEAPNPIFRWSSDGYQSYFTLQISLDSTFACSTATESLTTYEYFSADLRKLTTYYWRVKATNSSGSSAWSNTWSLTTGPVEWVATLKTPAWAVVVDSNYCFLAGDSGLSVIDITNPAAPFIAGSYHTAFSLSYSRIILKGTYAYVRYGYYLYIFDVANPASPSLVGQSTHGGITGQDMAVEGNYVYFCGTRQMDIIDISNPAAPVTVGVWYLPDTCYYKGPCNIASAVVIVGNYAYVSTTNALEVVDVSNPSAPSLAGSLPVYSAGDLEVSGSHLYSSAGFIINIANPTTPKIDTRYGSSWSGLSVWGNFISWVSASNYPFQGIEIADITNPTAPSLFGRYNTTVSGVAGKDTLVFVAAGNNGLKILKISP